ncbi:hypothetical protein [Ruania albidiflava]|uniref:hypothetical protein n=1 Tax=Ruania albidiflava TaxID=366586 RepID=UPI00040E1242|nr:hypothetical protein [Ruania albidiflava]
MSRVKVSRRSALKGIGVAAVAGAAAGGSTRYAGAAAASEVRRGDVHNVLDHGAAGDGEADDTAAFQSAIEAIRQAGSGTLLIPPRVYNLASKQAGACVVLDADNMTVRAEGARFMRPDEHARAMFVVNTRRDEPLDYGAGIRNLHWSGGRFIGDISQSNFICAFGLHNAQACTFDSIVFENCQAGASHTFDMVSANGIVIRQCEFLGQETREDTANVAEAVQIGAGYKGGLTGGHENWGFTGLMTRDVTIEDCRFLPYAGQAGPTPFGHHGGVEGKHHQRLRFLRNRVEDPRTSLVPPDSPADTVNRGLLHLSDAHDVEVIGNVFRQTEGRVSRVITVMGFDNGVLAGADPEDPARGEFRSPQAPANITIRDNEIEGFPAHEDYDAIYVRGLDGTLVPNVTINQNRVAGGYDAEGDSHGAGIRIGNVRDSRANANEITDYFRGVDAADGAVVAVELTDNSIRRSAPSAPAAITISPDMTDSEVTYNVAAGFETAVSGDAGPGTDVDHNTVLPPDS